MPLKLLMLIHKLYEEGNLILNYIVIISRRNNIQLIIMLRLQHYSNNYQLTS